MKNFKRKWWEFVLPTFQPNFGLLIPDGRSVLFKGTTSPTCSECEPRQEGGTDDVSSGPKLSSAQKSRGIYDGERQSERRIMSRERHQNVVDTVSNKCRCWKTLWTKDPGSYSATASVWQPVLLWQSTFSPISATQAVTSTRTRGQSALRAFFYMALNAVRSISVVYCYSIKFYLVKVMIYLLHLAEQTCALSHISTPLPDS